MSQLWFNDALKFVFSFTTRSWSGGGERRVGGVRSGVDGVESGVGGGDSGVDAGKGEISANSATKRHPATICNSNECE